jgi:glucokinase
MGQATSNERANEKCWVGFDLGGTKMLAAVFDSDFRLRARQRKKTKGHEGAESGLQRVVQAIRAASEEAGVEPSRLGGVGIGCAGALNLNKGEIHESPNLGWRDVPVRKFLQRELKCPVIVVNDVDAGVYGEFRFGAARDARCVVGVFPGTGIGGGCVYEGQILRGRNGSCMEIGHVPVMTDGPLCGCGQRGCLEAVASRLAISSAAAQAAYRGQAPHLLAMVGTDVSEIRSGILAEAIQAGDRVVEEIVLAAARHVGTAVATLVHLLGPDMVVLGGGLVEAMPKLFVETVAASARQRVLPSFSESFEVVAAKLGDDAIVRGAAAWAQHVTMESDE